MNYSGYLSPHLDLIHAAHARGDGSRAIAELLYLAGARARSTSAGELGINHHVRNLQCMALHVLGRLGLRARKSRHLNGRRGSDGAWTVL